MALRYKLSRHQLNGSIDQYKAVSVDNQMVGIDEIMDRMVGHGSTLTRAEVLGVLEEFNQVVADLLQTGVGVQTELFSIRPSIAGVFESDNAPFDANRHAIRLHLRPGRRLRDIPQRIVPEQIKGTPCQPRPSLLTDYKSGVQNQWLTVGQMASLTGQHLKVAVTHPDAGLFLIGRGNVSVAVPQLVTNRPSQLQFFVPDHLSPGAYYVEVRTVLKNHVSLVSGRLPFQIQVGNDGECKR